MASSFESYAVPHLALMEPGDDLAEPIIEGVAALGRNLASGDIVVIAQKVISKIEGRTVDLNQVTPSPRARDVADQCGKDPREVELILSESVEVLRAVPDILIVVHHTGVILANAGLDRSNVRSEGGQENVLLLPVDPDKSCQEIRARLLDLSGADVAVIISDSLGRPWRMGTTGIAIGVAGIPALLDLRGDEDLFGRELKVSQQAIADELASAAALLHGQGADKQPVVIIRGDFSWDQPDSGAGSLVRPKDMDLFR
ncbi:MAG: coenzyme F420-0:L-glutamate ligase [Rhodospirillaceae bacterium]|jgi:coenzyme F420-0:L-glutamate ligase / coenzyme F420-1:gamma-L-glutamate ligase|nr:coenzyme F420-0:L-glutamate ligase [Rhodospirillaceae bacterium]MBT5242813.1 coenzyme F420-0:L-glutamate ligase [Rhodospirillaceae bacterium]MBT5564014.1 coenzyme F420-0:L-glutamate ligase [Rhodospirillaceae bacterium]MBT6243289.1 coenzyme F420-0:L-glutamate ligase [Rhodospirillaceae bacterium]MBT7137584.1 coenzyme F420-0:L-glutamate ligase [Rhodospirillaceae bacterium]